ncbi:mitogen-activated protein kinase kinase kinase 20-like [Coffea arabica]|uniref:Mitogen-activated protein kinase kinase kinase 20-like n=1 Tax=Coffea arabica TaxID=13443 RepID=A0A6P6TUY6_COFAR|nr:mitogen-activated protein kinase kinase kinase 18-like [Coffea arabica]
MWIREKTLGSGSFGFVSIAKTIPSSFPDDEEDQLFFDLPPIIAVKSAEFSCSESLQRERLLLHEFQNCPQIIHCYGADVSEEDGHLLYNMLLEFASGGSLADYVHGSQYGLLEEEVKQFTRSVLLGLSYIHAEGYAHCDIKPANILLVDDEEGNRTAKISDFGLATKVSKRRTGRKRKKGNRGTLFYMAPESVMFGEYDSKVDIWALGCTVIEMFTKKPAWDFDFGQCTDLDDFDEFFDRIKNEEVEIPRGLSKDAQDFLAKCLIKNPGLRWTADMLSSHPFVSGLDKAPVDQEISEESAFSPMSDEPRIGSSEDDESSKDMDSIKPMLLLKNLARLDKVAAENSVSDRSLGLKPTLNESVSEKSYEFRLFKRRKGLDPEVLYEGIQCNANFGFLQAC